MFHRNSPFHRSSPRKSNAALIISVMLLCAAGANAAPFAGCLPASIKLMDVVEAAKPGGDGTPRVTVEDRLNSLGAVCSSEHKLVDRTGRPIEFGHLIGCWGHPPPDYEELLQQQRKQIETLKETSAVITMTCNPSGVRIP